MNETDLDRCPDHPVGPIKRDCKRCNSIYMRHYQRHRRKHDPVGVMVDRARERARLRGLPFRLRREHVQLPVRCPVLGIQLVRGAGRSPASPSLDRLVPNLGYIPGNVRVISDRANQLKGTMSVAQLNRRALTASRRLRADYAKIAAYVERECLLEEVRVKAQQPGRVGEEWRRLQTFLERRFAEIENV